MRRRLKPGARAPDLTDVEPAPLAPLRAARPPAPPVVEDEAPRRRGRARVTIEIAAVLGCFATAALGVLAWTVIPALQPREEPAAGAPDATPPAARAAGDEIARALRGAAGALAAAGPLALERPADLPLVVIARPGSAEYVPLVQRALVQRGFRRARPATAPALATVRDATRVVYRPGWQAAALLAARALGIDETSPATPADHVPRGVGLAVIVSDDAFDLLRRGPDADA